MTILYLSASCRMLQGHKKHITNTNFQDIPGPLVTYSHIHSFSQSRDLSTNDHPTNDDPPQRPATTPSRSSLSHFRCFVQQLNPERRGFHRQFRSFRWQRMVQAGSPKSQSLPMTDPWDFHGISNYMNG